MSDTIADLPDVAVVTAMADIRRSVADCWLSIGGFADAGRFLDVSSALVSGDGGIGSVRRIGDVVTEVMVGQSETSYTYVQTSGSMAPYLYHGCVAVRETGPDSCALTYTIAYDQSAMDAARRASELARIGARFQGAAEAMKRIAERGDAA